MSICFHHINRTFVSYTCVGVFLLVLFCPHAASAQKKASSPPKQKKVTESGYEIMRKVDEQSRKFKTHQLDVHMVIQDVSQRERERYFTQKKKIKNSITNSIIQFYRPSSVKGTGLLSVKDDKTSRSQQWVYLPALKSLRQLSTSDKGKSFMGSDFSNEDIAGRRLDQDSHKLVKSDKKYHYITSTPKGKDDPYSKMDIKVNRRIHVITKIVFYDRKGKKLKSLVSKKIKKIKGIYMIVFSVMNNQKTKGKTTLSINSINLGLKLSDNEVGIRGLKD